MMESIMRLAHGWELTMYSGFPRRWVGEFLHPAVRAVPTPLAERVGRCRVTLVPGFDDPTWNSQWTRIEAGVEISVATDELGHDVALELLTCVGQALWERLSRAEESSYWTLLDAEMRSKVGGEIDEQALEAKHRLLADRARARDVRCLEEYGRASFAATAAEFVHCLWHDTTIRTGEEYLPAAPLRQRLELLARWFPPDPGYALFPARGSASYGGWRVAASCSLHRQIRP